MRWMEGPLLGFDTETTGTDVWNDRIITAALVFKESYESPAVKYEWMINTGLEIPEEATKIHGITNEAMHEKGQPARKVLDEINLLVHTFAVERQAALIAFNAPYDLTILREDTLRAGGQFAGVFDVIPVIDPLVIDKQTDKYRKGKRNLSSTAEHFGIDSAGAHGALADVIMTMKVGYALARKYPKLQVPAPTLHEWTKGWKEIQNADYQSYLRKTKPDAVIDDAWPIEPPRERVTVGDGITW